MEPPALDHDDLVPELATLPTGLVLDGELVVAWGDDGSRCDRMIAHRWRARARPAAE